ncbi:gliding motility-associated C-terminal domain-containing protein [Tenacibaculum sp. AHE15PA]|uniref:T9SS type B sorting domain-containing protein n=1 Tax=unclassified Tenacibaculum TaxID=2635139 RepID=UPI001C4F9D1A|nr:MULTISPECIES: gliding motility-associated C-terminal domain-containing protein [unclassified Tenacibaculum]QXP72563.1 gliding motility-associated C-terminal domain-containing protein [Tenacibaculum sp. AHE14PA]QXP76477.1 gliding motility-associated C-terminal domain-containing protein [Tenacibaculum sp. AHE15PA]
MKKNYIYSSKNVVPMFFVFLFATIFSYGSPIDPIKVTNANWWEGYFDRLIPNTPSVNTSLRSYSSAMFAAPTIDLNSNTSGNNHDFQVQPVYFSIYGTSVSPIVTSDGNEITSATISLSGVVDEFELIYINNAEFTDGAAGAPYEYRFTTPNETHTHTYSGVQLTLTRTNSSFSVVRSGGGNIPNSVFLELLNDFNYGNDNDGVNNSPVYTDGIRTMDVTVTDTSGDTASAQTIIRVFTTLPTVIDDTNSVAANNTGTISGDVLINDSTTNAPLLVDDINLYQSSVGVAYTTLYGSIIIQPDGSYIYDVDETNTTVTGLKDTETIQDIFSYTAIDNLGITDTGILSIDINGVTEPPVAEDNFDTITVDVNNTINGNVITDDGPDGADAIDRGLSHLIWEDEFIDGEIVTGKSKTINATDLDFTTEDISSIGTTDDQKVFTTAQNGGHTGYLYFNIDPATNIPGATTDLVIDFDKPVFNLGFLLVDIDYSQGDTWQDQIRIEGTTAAGAVISSFNYITTEDVIATGNPTFYGTGSAPTTEATGNINVFFTEPIEKLRLSYGYGPAVTAVDPGFQIAGVSDIYWQDEASVSVITLEGNLVPPGGLVYAGTYGTITINPNGTYTYVLDTGNPAVSSLLVGQTLTETFNYLISDTFTSDDANLIITINGSACTVSAASSTETVCINTILTNITHSTAGATGISNNGVSGANGLPAGVSASWASDEITISGTPTASGTFNYSIELTGGCNPAVNATGTITVTPNNTAAAASTMPTLCIDTALTDITIATSGATGIGAATDLPAGVTASWSSDVITITGTPTASGIFNYSIPLTGGCGTVNATGTITVTPNNTAAGASTTPTLCIDTALTDITIATSGATGIGAATDLPAGVTASWSSDVITITGTPTASGIFNYSIPLTGGCGTVNATGTITVTPNNTAAGASTTPTLCIDTALTDITIATSGATGIGAATDLPAGVTASWSSDVITITGTPTASGIFNYSIPLTGGCGTVNATGTITVTPNNTAAGASTTPTLCIDTALTDITIATSGATGIGAATDLPAGVTASWSSDVITITGTPTASGIFNYSIPLTGGCGTVNATGTITVTPNNTAAGASTTPTLCIDTALTDITIATSGATGIGAATDLPAGVTASWSSDVITITGTPTASGIFNYSIPLTGGCGTVNATGTITVTPNNTAAGASTTPTLCIDTALTDITIATSGATGIGAATDLPAGVTASWSSDVITITGTPTASGIFNYSIPLTGGCGTVNATGTITVTPNNTAAGASTTPTLCIDTALTDITIATSGATGIGAATDLPAGVTASWSSDVITITGTPTASGIFNYSIPLTGGCGTVNATGTITVTPNNTAAGASTTPTLCIDTALTDITIATSGATGIGAATDLPAGVTASWSSDVITITGTPTASGIFNYSIPLTGGCGTVNATGTITVTPNNTAAGASTTPTLCIDTALTDITIATSGATGIGAATDLPAGVTASWSSDVITITGTPTASGIFNYSIPLTGGCGTVNATGTITVTPNNTAAGASTTPTLCIDTALTDITIATSGATGIGAATDLPAGVTASWSSDVITITGTPTASGIFNYSIPLTGGCGTVNATGTITVTPNNTAAGASTTPTLCIDTALTDITIATSGATGIGAATDLPAGVTASWSSDVITITGTPTASGIFNYSIPLTGGCGTVNATGTITITPNNTAAGASTTPTLCIDTALTDITIATSGATGIGAATDLPAGVTASWSSDVITITGTPTASGIFNYSIPLTGGCGTVNATGTITVTPNNTAAGASTTPTLCIDTALTDITIATSGATGIGAATDLPAGVTASWSSDVITITGTPTASGIFNYSIPLTGGCGTVNATGTITVTPNNTAAGASTTPTLCIDTALTDITIATSGATGIGAATDLPAGVTASWSSDVITITGTPTASGIFNYSIPLTGGCGTVNATGTITVTPNNTAAGASTTPTLCIDTALTDITIATSGATGIGAATDLPAGVTASWSSDVITITGTPTASGIFNYSIPLTGGCGTVNATGTITVTPNNTAAGASTTPTLCIDTALTDITIATSGATGIGAATDLPAGVTASWSSDVITITGTPTASGIFNYSIPLTGGCGTVNATGTITVTPNNTAAGASTTPTLCIDTALTDITIATSGATGIGAATDLPAGVTASWSSDVITITGTPTVSGIFNYSIPLTGGCGTVNATGTITVNALDDASFNYNAASYCQTGVDPTPTIGGLAGGTFTSSPAGLNIKPGNGGIDLDVSTPGTYTVTYTTSGACPNSSDVSVTINDLEHSSFNYSTGAYCADATDPTPTITGDTGGNFTSTVGLIINASSGVIDVSASTPGAYTVTYITTGPCPDSSDVSVTINSVPNAPGITGDNLLCNGEMTTLSTTAIGTIVWSSDTPGVASINTSTGEVSAVSAGTTNITYTVTDGNGCSTESSSFTITVSCIDAVVDDFTATPVDGAAGGTSGDVTANDTLNGVAVVDSEINITLDNDDGSGITIDGNGNVVVPAGTDSGNYTLTYTICEIAVPSNCDTTTVDVIVNGTIDAVVDDFTATPVDGAAGGTSGDVTANDTLNGVAVVDSEINITLDNDDGSGITIDGNGNVVVPAGTDSGNYTLTYTICEIAVPSNCDTTTVDVIVNGTIDAVVDDFTATPVDGAAGGTSGDVTANDTLNGVAVVDSEINITLDNDDGSGITIDGNGNVVVPAGTDSGNYTLTYTICEIAVPSNCDTTTVDVIVNGTIDAVVDDFTATPVDGAAGGTSGDVTANDTLNGVAVVDSEINITLDNDDGSGITIDGNGNVVVPAGTDSGNYTLTYTICEIAVPSNCDTTTVDVIVNGTIDAVVDDFTATPVDGAAGGTSGDVTANDTLNGVAVVDSEINITLDNDDGSGITIDGNGNVVVPAGTDSGNYTLTYTICEIAVPSNCDTTTVDVIVNGTIDAVVDDFTATPVDGAAGGTSGDVTANDTLNGVAVVDSEINITLDNDDGSGITIDGNGNVVVPAGTDSGNYTLTYTICEIAVPSNCDTTTVDVIVNGTTDAVVDDFTATPVDGAAGGTSGDVTANDTLNGVAVVDSEINITLDNDDGSGITIDGNGNVVVPAGTDSGNYTLTYTICEIAVPSNCDTTTVDVIVNGTIDAVVDDFTATPVDGAAGGTSGDVTANDTLNGVAVVDSEINITLDNDDGSGITIDGNGNVVVPAGTDSGNYTLTYTICEIAVPSNCDTTTVDVIVNGTIDAVVDDFTATPVDGAAGGTSGDVTANDTLNGVAVVDSEINITLDNDDGSGITIDGNGNVVVPAGTDSGNYTLTYTICEIAVPSNCDTTTVDVIVNGTIDAVVDDFTATPVDGAAGGTSGDVTANDTLNGVAVVDSEINITLDNDDGSGITIDGNGNVVVPAGTDSGNYTLTYTICEIAVPSNCDTTTVDVIVNGTIDAVVDDFTATPVDGAAGGTSGDVTANDTLNGVAVVDSEINITLDNDDGSGITIDGNGNVVVPAGTDSGNYTLTYTICEIAVPSNCDTTTVDVIVNGTIDAVVDDFTATPVDGAAGGTSGDVTVNDTLNGVAVVDSEINITLDNDDGSGITIDGNGNVVVPAGTDSGNYTLTYTICEIAVPSNCDTTTVDVIVNGTIDAVVDDFTATPVDGAAGGTSGDVTANDTLNGVAVVDSEINITLDNDDGSGITIDGNGNVVVPAGTDSGNYTLTYTICEIAVPSNCDTTTVDVIVNGTIDAVVDDFTATPVDGAAGGTSGDVTANDTLNGVAVVDSEINITLDNDDGSGITIDGNGNVVVPAGTDSGNYTLTYTICEIAVPSNCDTTTVDVIVNGTIDAVVDDFTATPVDGAAGGTSGDVTANDTLNGVAVVDSEINITLDNDDGSGITIDGNGNVVVPAGTDSGNYTLTYTICEIAVPSNCDTTTVDVIVNGTIDAVVDDFTATPVDGAAGGTSGDVTANDTLNGVAVVDSEINITLDNDDGSGITIDGNGNVVVPAGTDSGNYTLTYTICEIAVPSNCDTTTVDVIVNGTIDAVVDDFTATPVDGAAGGTSGDVTANDTLNGVAVVDSEINITLDNDDGSGITIDGNGNVVVPAGTDSGNYTLTYTICEIAVPSNCDTTTVDVIVNGTIDAVVDDFTATPVDGAAGGTSGDVTVNDTLNGVAVVDSEINITLDNDDGSGITIDGNGNVVVPAGTDSGNYTLTYTICEIAVPSNCDTTTVDVIVNGTIDAVVDDFTATPVDGAAGGTSGDVTANDTLNGVAVVDSEINITLDNDDGSGITIDGNGNVVVPAGTDSGNYTLTYTICEIAVPSNCDTTTVDVIVNGTIDAVVDDFTATPVDGAAGGTSGDVTANDTLNGVAVVDSEINITLDNDDGSGITIDGNGNVVVPAGTDSGNYTLTYTICEIAVPSNCDTTTVDVIVNGTIDAVVDDFTATSVDGAAGGTSGDVTANDTLNGVAVVDSEINITLDNDDGSGITIDGNGNVVVPAGTDSGNYTLTYTICEIAVPSNCDTTTVDVIVNGTIDAVVDDFTATPVDGAAGGTSGDVTANDTLNGVAVVDSEINITLDNDDGSGITIDGNGNVVVPAGTDSGNYTLTYTICEIAVPSNCDTTTVDVTVNGTIDAVVDDFTATPVDGAAGGTSGDVTANDTLNGVAVVDSEINITLDNDDGSGITIDGNGNVVVPAGTDSGNYTLTYTICEIAVPSNCDTTTVDVTVNGTIDAVVDDFTATPVDGAAGGTSGDVTANDTLNGVAVVDSEINITLDNDDGSGITIDGNGNVVVPAGTGSGNYTLTYTICEIAVPSNCDTTTVDVIVNGTIDAVVDDFTATPVDGAAGGTSGDVTANDTLNGVAVVDSEINITLDNDDGSGITIDGNGNVVVPAGTDSGNYTLTYTICEIAVPSNCDTTTVDVIVFLDTDGDGIVDADDIDDDNDGIPDAAEGNGDTDGDGVPDSLDLDSDNDGILDVDEGGNGDLDTNSDGVIDTNDGASGADTNGDGQADASVDADEEPDTDGDGVPDYQDLDSDNDGINDVIEDDNIDANNDGIADGIDADGDGIVDSADADDANFGEGNGGEPDNTDSDGDGVPDYQDLDSDDDGINDVVEGGNDDSDANGDGIVDGDDSDGDGILDEVDDDNGNFGDAGNTDVNDTDPTDPTDGGNGTVGDSGTDADGDGIADSVDGDDANFGDAIDTDGDGIVDADDIDDDNDGIPDALEGNDDTDGDGVPDSLDLDSDNDGILDVDEGGNADLDTNGDGVIDTNDGASGADTNGDGQADASVDADEEPDTDGDGVPDYQDLDSDNDGINDVIEDDNIDANNDGIADGIDADGDGIVDSADADDANFGEGNGGEPDNTDSDGDGVPDYQDLDSDDDGINDVVEGGNDDSDANGDGIVDGDDSDGDGILDEVDDDNGNFGDAGNTDVNDTDPTDPTDGGNGTVGDSGTDADGDGIADSVDGDDGVFGDAEACIKIFNEFTPNGDGNNDVFVIDCIENYPNNSLEIYNRWGNTVYKASGYNNTDVSFKGISNGRVTINEEGKLPVGTYFYVLDLGDGSEPTSGWLYINR